MKDSNIDTRINSLPKEWEIISFLDATLNKKVKVGKVNKRDYQMIGKYPVIDQSQEYIAGYSDDSNQLFEGNLPVVVFGDHTRIFKFVDFPFIRGADGIKVLLPNTVIIDPKFYFFSLKNLRIPSKGYNRHYKLLKEQYFALPPLSEQRAIAQVLSTVRKAIEATEKVITAVREFKRSMMKHLFTYGPVPIDQVDQVLLKQTEIGEVPEGWDIVRLGDNSHLITKGSSPRWQGFDYRDYGLIFVRSQNVGLGRLELDEITYLPEEFNEAQKRSIIKTDDVLINIVGASIGRVALATREIAGGNLNQAVAIARVKDKLNPGFIMFFLLTEGGQEQIFRQVKEVARANLSLQDIRNFSVPCPSLQIQSIVVELIETIDNKLLAEVGRKYSLESLFNSLLHHLMTGKVRVNDLEGLSI